jgi:Tol biopolymer transport system component
MRRTAMIAVVVSVLAGCAVSAPTATQPAPVASPVDTVTPAPTAVAVSTPPATGSPRPATASPAQTGPPLGLAANGPIVYSENGDIYSRDLATGTATLLVGGPEVDVGPSFARDGSRFSFVRVTGEDPETIALMVANADGSDVHMVVEPELVGDRHWFEWSPDSDMLMVQNSADGVPPLSVVNVIGEPERRAIDVPLEVHQVDWRLGADELILLGREPEAAPTSPRALYAVAMDGTGLRQLVPPPDSGTLAGGAFSLSHDGRFLAYTTVSNATGHVSSHTLDLDSGETRSLGGWFNQGWPTFSPDGERLALVRYPGTGAAAQAFIVSSAGDGTDAVAIGPEVRNRPGTPGLRIQFSPDGTKLLIVHAAGAQAWVADVVTGEYESVGLGDDQWVSWQRLAP